MTIPAASNSKLPGVFLMSDSFETGGSERQFAALAKSLDQHAFRVYLGCMQKTGAFLEGLGEVPDFPFGGSLYGWESWQARGKIARYMHQNQVSIAHAFDFYTNLALIPAARWARIPVVIGSQRQLGDLLKPAQFKVQLLAFHLCDIVICNSRAAADRLVEKGLPERKIAVIGNGLPDSAFLRTTSILPNRPGLRVGMVARMNTRSKNHRGLLRAAALLKHRFPQAEYVLAGDGPVRADLEKEASDLGITDRVAFLGDRRDIPAVLSSVDVTVLPSFSESLSNSIIESMALGVPVVGLRVGGNPELVSEKAGEERGVLVSPGSDEALAEGLGRLLGDKDLRLRMGANARSFALATFTIDSMRQRHEELYAELLHKKGYRSA